MPTVDPTKPNVPPLIAEILTLFLSLIGQIVNGWSVLECCFSCVGLHTSGWFFWTLGLLGDPLWEVARYMHERGSVVALVGLQGPDWL